MKKEWIRKTLRACILPALLLAVLWTSARPAHAAYGLPSVLEITHGCDVCQKNMGYIENRRTDEYLLSPMTHTIKLRILDEYAGEFSPENISWKVTKEYIEGIAGSGAPKTFQKFDVAEGTGDTISLSVKDKGWWNYNIEAKVLKDGYIATATTHATFRTAEAVFYNEDGTSWPVHLTGTVGKAFDFSKVKVRKFTAANLTSGGEVVTLDNAAKGILESTSRKKEEITVSGKATAAGSYTLHSGLKATASAEVTYQPDFLFGNSVEEREAFVDETSINVRFKKSSDTENTETNATKPTEKKKAVVTVPAVKKLKVKAGKKKLTVTWKAAAKSAKVTGYEVSYRLKTAKKWKVKKVGASKKKLVIKKLKRKKKYTVRIRALKKVGGKTYTGAYTKAKAVKVK
ncbi:MAG: fibronectin type III domain-containing protein [Lachnospiraceae bacterium]|nr:fibronectin type III domain-containing protein [Lachnospiraceae bacterium]